MPSADVLVVVPAHNEEQVIERGLRALLEVSDLRVRVVVVANGCSDATADVARDVPDHRVEVIELAAGGKARAVRAGFDRAAGEGVVAVVDADVVLDRAALPGLVDVLAVDEARIAAPALVLDLGACSWWVRRYYAAWRREAHVARGDIGARGIYAVNPAGLERLVSMPDIIADDGWAKARFAPEERRVTEGTSTVRPARTWVAQVRRRARVIAGNRELRQVYPLHERPPSRTSSHPTGRTSLTRLRQDGVVDTAAWYSVELPARLLETYRRRRGRSTPWSQDVTTRG